MWNSSFSMIFCTLSYKTSMSSFRTERDRFFHPLKMTEPFLVNRLNFKESLLYIQNILLHIFFILCSTCRIFSMLNSRRTFGRIDANFWTTACTRWPSLHISTPCLVVCFWHSIYPGWQSLNTIESSCTALPSFESLGKFSSTLLCHLKSTTCVSIIST